MNAQGSRIILYSAAARSDEELLREQLCGIGYTDITPFAPGATAQELTLDGQFAVVIALVTDAGHSAASMLSSITGFGSLPVLGLFSHGCARRYDSAIDACRDVAIWPCGKQELDFRVGKMFPHDLGSECLGDRLFVKMNILGNSPEFRKVLDQVCKITLCDAPVYIDGETGTGKDLVARAIHYMSSRRDKPFIAANCGAIPDQLIENEFFGHEKGAYTDARERSDGLIAQAEGGTLFLDEIETLSPKGQVVLLRFLENMLYRPLGGNTAKTADLRIITATNESIDRLVEQGRFRRDLFYRINIMNLAIPPLRERRGDIELLAEYFIRRYQAQYRQPGKGLHPVSLQSLRYYDWPGNVRELENLLHREFLMADGDQVRLREIESLQSERRDTRGDRRMQNLFGLPLTKAKHSLIDEFERRYLRAALDRARGNVSEAARLAGKERRSFTRLLEKYCVDRSRYKTR